MPGHPASLRGTYDPDEFEGLDGNIYDFKIHQYGDIGVDGPNGLTICCNVGKEFNLLQEFVYGVKNPYADPTRGTIKPQTIVEPSVVAPFEWKQAKFLQNLAGKHNIIGKSIVVTDVTNPASPST